MTDISVGAPIQPHELPKPMRQGIEHIVEKVVARAAIEGAGQNLLLRVYLAGIYHGSALSRMKEDSNGRRRNSEVIPRAGNRQGHPG